MKGLTITTLFLAQPMGAALTIGVGFPFRYMSREETGTVTKAKPQSERPRIVAAGVLSRIWQ